jgi:CheY-like chemotaxis protein
LVLVVDDEAPILDVARVALQTHGYRVLAAGGGAAAISALRDHGEEISVVLLDMMMPEMSGAATIVALREICPHVAIIASSGRQHALRNRESIGQVQALLPKPYTTEQLLQTLGQVILERRNDATAFSGR